MSPLSTPRLRQQRAQLVDAFRVEWSTDRLALQPAVRRAPVRWAAWGTIAVLYVLGWGRSTIAAVDVLLGADAPSRPLGPDTVFAQAMYLLFLVFVASLGVQAMRAFRLVPQPASPEPRSTLQLRWHAFALAIVAMLIGFALSQVTRLVSVPTNSYPWPEADGAPATLLWALTTMMAGPMEEGILLGVVVVALRRAGYGWLTVSAVAVAVRIPFHLFYGWGALLLVVWVLLLVALYRRTGTIWPIMAAHALWNLAAMPPLEVIGDALHLALLFVGFTTLGLVVVRVARRALEASPRTQVGRRG